MKNERDLLYTYLKQRSKKLRRFEYTLKLFQTPD